MRIMVTDKNGLPSGETIIWNFDVNRVHLLEDNLNTPLYAEDIANAEDADSCVPEATYILLCSAILAGMVTEKHTKKEKNYEAMV